MARSQTWEEQLAGGPLNQAALEQLRESFDTYRLLDAVDAVDAMPFGTACVSPTRCAMTCCICMT